LNLLAFCHDCGLTFPSGFGVSNQSIALANVINCPRCGGFGEIQNQLPVNGVPQLSAGNTEIAVNAFRDFQVYSIETLSKLNVSRQQARRFHRAVERKGDDAIERIASEIDPIVSSALDEARKTEDPKKARQWLADLVKLLAVAGGGLLATLGGVNEGLDLMERLNGGTPIHEILEQLKSKHDVDERGAKPGKKETEKNGEKGYSPTSGPIDV